MSSTHLRLGRAEGIPWGGFLVAEARPMGGAADLPARDQGPRGCFVGAAVGRPPSRGCVFRPWEVDRRCAALVWLVPVASDRRPAAWHAHRGGGSAAAAGGSGHEVRRRWAGSSPTASLLAAAARSSDTRGGDCVRAIGVYWAKLQPEDHCLLAATTFFLAEEREDLRRKPCLALCRC